MPDIERKLTTIMAADVAGYSAMMERNEEATLETLREHRATMRGFIERHRGRIANTAGDSVMAEFPSVLEAVTAAVEIQQELGVRNATLDPDRQMQFRIGINLGDVMVEGEDLFGEGVNVAARLESVAEPGGIVISGTVYELVKNKLTLSYDFLGDQRVKNLSDEIPMYRIETDPPAPRVPGSDRVESDAAASAPGLANTLGSLGEKLGKIIEERVDDDEVAERLSQRLEGRDLGDAIHRKVEEARDRGPGVHGVPVIRVRRGSRRMIANLVVIIGVLAGIDAIGGDGWWVQWPAIVALALVGLSFAKGVWNLAVLAGAVALWDLAGGNGWWSQGIWIGAGALIALSYVARIGRSQ